jgi:ADP-heptose:LPS heptosyltransferase
VTSRILFVRTDRLGETILTLPALRALRAAMPQAHVILMVGALVHELLAQYPDADEVVAEPQLGDAWWQRAGRLSRLWRAWRVQTVLVFNPKKEYHAAAWLAGIPQRVGYDCKWGRLLTHRVPDRTRLGERHEVERHLDLVRLLGVPVARPQWQWPSFTRERDEVARLLTAHGGRASEGFVVVHPWTSHPGKQWPWTRYREVIRVMSERHAAGVVVIGGPEERARAQAVLPREARVVDLIGRLSLSQLAALLRQARALVSNDSGPVHLAAALGTPTVALFGTSDPAAGPARWGPWGSGHTVICKSHMDHIEIDDVLHAIQRYL